MKRILVGIGIAFLLGGCHMSGAPGDGQKKGQIVKLEKVGILSKTWEAELIRGGFSDGGGTIGKSFHFTIENMALLPACMEALDKQQEVLISYNTELFSALWRSEVGTIFLTRIEK